MNLMTFLLTRLMRGVTKRVLAKRHSLLFLLTRLMRGVTLSTQDGAPQRGFLLTRLMRGVTKQGGQRIVPQIISTHTPHARRDRCNTV